MPFDGSGNYVPASAPNFPAVGGTTIASAYYNAVINDVAAALSLCITRDGQGKPSANQNWNGKNLTNVGTFAATSASFTNALPISSGGTGVLTVPANGQVLIGNGAGYVLGNITGAGGITVTNGAGTIALAIGGAITATELTASSGVLLGNAAAATGPIQEITIGSGLSLSAGGVLSATGGGSGTISNLTFNNGGAGAASGTIYNGGTAKTISWNTVGAQPATPQFASSASGATITPNSSNDGTIVTALAINLTLANPSGAPTNLLGHVIRIKDNGTSRTIAYGTQYRAVGVTLPTATTINKVLYLGMLWNNDDSKWDVVSVAQQ